MSTLEDYTGRELVRLAGVLAKGVRADLRRLPTASSHANRSRKARRAIVQMSSLRAAIAYAEAIDLDATPTSALTNADRDALLARCRTDHLEGLKNAPAAMAELGPRLEALRRRVQVADDLARRELRDERVRARKAAA